MSQPSTQDSSQYILNKSFDPNFQISQVELCGYDSANGVLRPLATDANGQIYVSGALSQTAADALYLKLTAANQTLTGNLAITGTLGAGATTLTSLNTHTIPGGTGTLMLTSGKAADTSKIDGDTVTTTTPAVDQILKYNGSAWVNGAETTVNGGSGVDFFYVDTASDIATYVTLNKSPDSGAEVDDQVTANNNTVLMDSYASASGGLGGTQIDAGVWTFDAWAYCSLLTLESHLKFDIYKRTSGGTETLLFSVNTPTITTTSLGTVDLYTISSVQQAFAINATDRLVVKISGVTSNVTNTVIHFLHGGTTHYSHFNTPLVIRHDDLAGLNAGDYQHLTAANATDLTDGGDTTLHVHSGYVSLSGLFGNGIDGDVTLSADAALSKDMQYNSLDLAGYTMNPNGFKIFCRAPIQMNSGTFSRAGLHGLNWATHASGATGGTTNGANIALNAGSIGVPVAINLIQSGEIGKTTASNGINSTAGSPGNSTANSVGINGVAGVHYSGGAGGNAGTYTGGTANASGGAAGTAAAPLATAGVYTDYTSFIRWRALIGTQPLQGNAASGQANTGASGACPTGSVGPSGGGGSSGSPGGSAGTILIFAPEIVGPGTIDIHGGDGGDGGNGGNASNNAGGGGAGGGGNGGAGGIFATVTHVAVTGLTYIVDSVGGNHGNGGLGNGTGSNGSDGLDGVPGPAGQIKAVLI